MTFSIITPSFKQLDWLRLCVASVRDQVGLESSVERRASSASNPSPLDARLSTPPSSPRPSTPAPRPLRVEHIIQDAGTPGIEDFAREIGAEFYRDGEKIDDFSLPIAVNNNQPSSINNYTCKVYCERDNGMYDAINRGFSRACGEIYAYINCDEQYLPEALAGVAEFFNCHNGVEAAFGDAIIVDGSGGYICHRKGLPPQLPHTLVSGNLALTTAATFCRKAIFSERGIYFDTEWKAMGDVAWAAALCHARVPMKALSKTTSVFADLGSNLGIGKTAMQEQEKLRKSAPRWMQRFRNLIILHYRLRKALSGAYSIRPGTYRIFTRDCPDARQEFRFDKPTHRWVGR